MTYLLSDSTKIFLESYDGPDRVVSAAEFRENNASTQDDLKLKTGYPTLDTLMDGVMFGELIVVSGPTKHGKSTFCLTLSRNFERIGIKTLFFSFEMPASILLCQRYKTLSTHVPMENVPGSIEWLEERVIEGALKFHTRVVFVDHLHFVADIFRMKHPSLEIGAVMRSIKSMAMNHKIVIFLIAHTAKLGRDFQGALTEHDVRDSSFITQEADSTLMVHRFFKDEQTKKMIISETKSQIIVCNHRRTGVMGKKMIVNKIGDFYEEHDNMEVKDGINTEDFVSSRGWES